MAVYLIDFENVTSAGISGIQRLTKEDKVYIFYTVNAANMSFAAHMNLLSSPAEVIYYNVTSGGKNALDFQLASFLGYLISKDEDKDFYIISNDKGYDHVKNFWERSGIAEGVKIHSAPSINRSLMPAEKPFTSKIQQTQQAQQTVTQQSGLSLEQLEQMKAETDKYTAQKKAAEAVSKEANAGEDTEKNNADTETNTPKAKKSQAKPANPEKNTAETEAAEEKPVKRRGRPKKQVTEVPEKAENEAKNEETPEISGEAFANQAEIPEEIEKENKKPAPKVKPAEKTAKAKSKEAAMRSLRKAIRPFLEKAGIKSDGDIINIANLLKSADGKQQFYCKLTKSYGMEKGLTAYKAVRTEYTNLTKLVKQ